MPRPGAAHAVPGRAIAGVAAQEFLREVGAIVLREAIGTGRQRRADGDGDSSGSRRFAEPGSLFLVEGRRPEHGATRSPRADKPSAQPDQ
jgi:hypothetical protein